MKCFVTGELRGLERKVSAKGNAYYVYHCEDVDTGKPFDLSSNELFPGVKKGDVCVFSCDFVAGRDWHKFNILSVDCDAGDVSDS